MNNVEDALKVLEQAIQPVHLNDLQELVFRQCWVGESYSQIATQGGYQEEYIKQVGSQLWKILSQRLGEKVTKSNIRSILRRHSEEQPESPPLPLSPPLLPSPSPPLSSHQDWGDAIDIPAFYGRTEELVKLEQWIVQERCRLVMLLGIGGIGKTTLAVSLGKQIQHNFEYVIWRSLRYAPPVLDLLAELIQFLSQEQETNLPPTLESRLSRLMYYLRSHRCLLILDNAESILQSGDIIGRYIDGYEDYGELFRSVGEISSQSVLLLTSREKPFGLAAKEGEALFIRSLKLAGLTADESLQVFRAKGANSGSEAEWQALIAHYGGHPLAIQMVAAIVRESLEGKISHVVELLEQGSLVFDDIRDLLNRQFNRLSAKEKEVMYWLAVNREPVSFPQLQADCISNGNSQLLEALNGLNSRSLIETTNSRFTQQPVVMEYMTQRLIEQVCAEISGQEGLNLFPAYALLKTTVKDYIRASQRRHILAPIAEQLRTTFESPLALEQQLQNILSQLRSPHGVITKFSTPNYGAGNLINLCCQLQIDLTNYDFSDLTIWHACLQKVNLHRVNLAYSNLAKSIFTQTLGAIFALAFSPDGKFLATGELNGKVCLWQVADNLLISTFLAHTSWLSAITFSPDSMTLVTSSGDCTVRFWDVRSGEALEILTIDNSQILSVAFNPDGSILATGSDDHVVRLWDVATRKIVKTFIGHTDQVWSVRFSPNGTTLITGSADKTVKIWDLAGNNRTLHGHTDQVWSVRFSPDGQTLATCSADHTVKIWDLDGTLVKTLLGHTGEVCCLEFSPDGKMLATSSADQTVKLWDLNTGQIWKTLRGHTAWIRSVKFSPVREASPKEIGYTLASGSSDYTVKFWDARTGQLGRTWQGHTNWIWSVKFNFDGTQIVSGGGDNMVRVWDVESGKILYTGQEHTSWVMAVEFSPDGCKVASVSTDHNVCLWDNNTGKLWKTLQGHTSQIFTVKFSPDGKILATGGADRTVKLWNLQTGKVFQTFSGHTYWVRSIAFSPDGEMLASASFDRTVRLWNIQTGQCKIMSGHTDWVTSIAFSPNGILLATGSIDNTIRVWNINDCEVRNTFLGHTSQIFGVKFSPDGHTLASCSADWTVKIWDVRSQQLLLTLSDHSDQVLCVDFSPDGETLISSSADETIKLWDVKTGSCIRTFSPPKPYDGMNITGVTGLTSATIATLKALGAVED